MGEWRLKTVTQNCRHFDPWLGFEPSPWKLTCPQQQETEFLLPCRRGFCKGKDVISFLPNSSGSTSLLLMDEMRVFGNPPKQPTTGTVQWHPKRNETKAWILQVRFTVCMMDSQQGIGLQWHYGNLISFLSMCGSGGTGLHNILNRTLCSVNRWQSFSQWTKHTVQNVV